MSRLVFVFQAEDLILKQVILFLGKDEVSGPSPDISSRTPEHVVSMGLGVFFLRKSKLLKYDLRPHT